MLFRSIIWASLVCLILVSGTVSSHKAVNSGGGVCVWGSSLADLTSWVSLLISHWPELGQCPSLDQSLVETMDVFQLVQTNQDLLPGGNGMLPVDLL